MKIIISKKQSSKDKEKDGGKSKKKDSKDKDRDTVSTPSKKSGGPGVMPEPVEKPWEATWAKAEGKKHSGGNSLAHKKFDGEGRREDLAEQYKRAR